MVCYIPLKCTPPISEITNENSPCLLYPVIDGGFKSVDPHNFVGTLLHCNTSIRT